MWIFGYGSLIWKPGFVWEERREGFVEHWVRRFWQESTDHRGVPQAPGRVVTLVAERGARTWGAAYRIAGAHEAEVIAQLDHREKGGYTRHVVPVHGGSGELVTAQAVLWIGGPDNPNWAGPLDTEAIARIVATATGPSGTNLEYAVRLHEALHAMSAADDHVDAIVQRALEYRRALESV